jgi:hypothetical protein
MSVQYRLIDNRRDSSAIIREFEDEIRNIKKRFYKGLVRLIVSYSPVDTGTYMDEHVVLARRSGSTRSVSSHGKPRKQPRGAFEADALARLTSQVDALPDDADEVVIANFAAHARFVEVGRAGAPGYLVYRRARANALPIINAILRSS